MKIDNTKQLEQVIKLCRKNGVDAMKIDNVEFHLGPVPYTAPKTKETVHYTAPTYTPGGVTEELKIPTDGLTEEQLLFYSAQGHTDQETIS